MQNLTFHYSHSRSFPHFPHCMYVEIWTGTLAHTLQSEPHERQDYDVSPSVKKLFGFFFTDIKLIRRVI